MESPLAPSNSSEIRLEIVVIATSQDEDFSQIYSAAFCPFFFGPAAFLPNTGFKNRPV
jgi:hypothetical protein